MSLVTCNDVGSMDRSAYVSGLRDMSPDSQGVDGFVGADGFVGVDGSVGNVVSDSNVSNDVSVDRDMSSSIVSVDASNSEGVCKVCMSVMILIMLLRMSVVVLMFRS